MKLCMVMTSKLTLRVKHSELEGMPVELLSLWMYNCFLVREQLKDTGQTMGGLQLAKPCEGDTEMRPLIYKDTLRLG